MWHAVYITMHALITFAIIIQIATRGPISYIIAIVVSIRHVENHRLIKLPVE